jgi:hypothetical protein
MKRHIYVVDEGSNWGTPRDVIVFLTSWMHTYSIRNKMKRQLNLERDFYNLGEGDEV